MSFFNKEQIKAFSTGRYICSKCGSIMEFENEFEYTLICPSCNHDVETERYGCENDEEYDALYPTYEQVMGCEDDDDCDEDEDDDNGCNEYDNEEEYHLR